MRKGCLRDGMFSLKKGVLKSYVTNCYTARKLGLRSTGSAARGLAGNPGTGAGNFYMEAGTSTPEEILGGVKQGLYVTQTMGVGINLVTGDFSQGAAGLWIENGELTFSSGGDYDCRESEGDVPEHFECGE